MVFGMGLHNQSFGGLSVDSRRRMQILETVDFSVLQSGMSARLRFTPLQFPPKMEPYVSEEEWKEFQMIVDEAARQMKWNTYRPIVIVLLVFVAMLILNAADDIGEGFFLGDASICVLVFLGVVIILMSCLELIEHSTRRSVFQNLNRICKEFSEELRPRGACVILRSFEHDDQGHIMDLTFLRIVLPGEAMLNVA